MKGYSIDIGHASSCLVVDATFNILEEDSSPP